ncbi:MAG: hypothetical protein NTW21_36460 [Verrucomicrobia bacterium]|nr:hypothetical protein [Verrucomicrobiota bacterium]
MHRLHRLLPVIRMIRVRRSFHFDKPGSGVALFSEVILLFSAPKKFVLPDALFTDDAGAAFQATPKIRVEKRLPISQIDSARAKRKGSCVVVRGTLCGGARFSFRVPRHEAGHLVEALEGLLGSRLATGLSSEDYSKPLARNRLLPVLGASALLLLGLAESIVGWRQFSSNVFGVAPLFFFYGSLLAIFSGVFLGKVLLTSVAGKRGSDREPFRSPTLGIVLRILGIALFFLGHFYSAGIGDWLFRQKLPSQAEAINRFALVNSLTVFFCYSGALLVYFGYRFSLRGAFSALKDDCRPPVVYLRSFDDDGKNNLNPDTFTAKILGLRVFSILQMLGPIENLYPPRLLKLVFGTAMDTAEEQLASCFRKLGPFIAFGKPGELVATGGADRLYVSHEVWQQKFLDLLGRSSGVVLQPAHTRSIWWEIRTCLERVQRGRLLLCFAAFEESPQAYEEFRIRFEDLAGCQLPRTLGCSQFIWFDPQGTARELPNRYRSPLLWPLVGVGLDLKATLRPFLRHLHPELFTKAPRPKRPFLFALGKVAAIVCWPLIIFGGPSWFNLSQDMNRKFNFLDEAVMVEHHGQGADYVLKLPSTWESLDSPVGSDLLCRSSDQLVSVGVQIVDQFPEEVNEIAQLYLLAMDSQLEEPLVELGRRRVSRQGKEWLQIQIRSKVPGVLLPTFQVLDFYSGAEGKFVIISTTAAFHVDRAPARKEGLRHIADGFQLPPPNPMVQTPSKVATSVPDDTRFTLQLPPGWVVSKQSFPGWHPFQYGESVSVMFLVTMEPPRTPDSTPKSLAEHFKGLILGDGGKDVRLGDIETVHIGTRDWIRFRIRAKVNNLDVISLYAICVGTEATCTTISITQTDQLATSEPNFQQIFAALRLNFH